MPKYNFDINSVKVYNNNDKLECSKCVYYKNEQCDFHFFPGSIACRNTQFYNTVDYKSNLKKEFL